MNSDILLFINDMAGESALLDAFMVFAAQDLVFILAAIALVCLGLQVYKKEWKPIIYFFVSLVVTYLVLRFMMLLNVDQRPFMDHALTQLIPHAPGHSFPSNHTTFSTAIAVSLMLFTRFKKTGVWLLVGAVLIGFSRIFVGVHYPADIVGGLFTGSIGGLLAFVIYRAMEQDKALRQEQKDD